MSGSAKPGSLDAFRGRHAGETIVVCGCGPSLNELPRPTSGLTIGVNDVGRLFDPTYLVVVNPKPQFKGDRFAHVEHSKAQALFTQLELGPVRPPVVRFRLGRYGGTDDGAGQVLHYTQNSPYVAVCLAALMGARRIGLIGVDFTEHHFFAATGRHVLAGRLREIDAQYGRLAEALRGRGVELVNLSGISRLVSLPRKVANQEPAAAVPPDTRSAPSVVTPMPRPSQPRSETMKIAIQNRGSGAVSDLLDALAHSAARLGHTVSRDPRRTASDPHVLSIVWNGSGHRSRGPTLYCEHGWLPRADYQISPRGINADSHAAPFAWDGRPLSPEQSALLDVRLAAIKQASFEGHYQYMQANKGVAPDLPPHFLLVPLQIESDTNILRHAPSHLRKMQGLIDHVARVNPPWPVIFKQHPADSRRGNRHLSLKMRRRQDMLWPQSRGNIHQMLKSPGCRGILTLNSNVAHDGLLWDVPAIVLARNVWPSQGADTPFLTAIPSNWSLLQASVTDPGAVACRRAYAHFLLQHQWSLADARNPERVKEILALAAHPERKALRQAPPPAVAPVRERKLVPLLPVARPSRPVINVVARDLGWLFETWKRVLVKTGHPSFDVVATQQPMPRAHAWVYIRAREAATTPDASRTLVQVHDLLDGGRYRAGGERAAVARCAGISLTHPAQEALLAASGVDLARRHVLMQPVGWSGEAGARQASDADALPTVAWVGRPALLEGADASGLDAFVQSAQALRGRARVVLVGERLERASQRLKAAGVSCAALGMHQMPQHGASEWLARFDAVAVTSTADAGPWPLFDALQAGVPVVATRVGWAPTLLHDGVCGRLVENAEDMGQSLLEVIEQRAQWRQAGAAMRERVAPYSMAAWAQANLELAAELAGLETRRVA